MNNTQSKLPRTERNPELTRQAILDTAFMEIFRNGFQGMRLENILTETGLTKGALYHHFKNKQTLGYAVIEDIIQPMIESIWVKPLEASNNPLDTLQTVIKTLPDMKPDELIQFGCPLNNLVQEMSPLDEGFRKRLDAVMSLWHESTKAALQAGVQSGQIRQDTNCEETAMFIMAAVEGCIGLAKSSQSLERLRTCLKSISGYLASLTIDASNR
ncbi:MAG: TetR/AcrR family transcriptional regulator [Gammaproteobacteria bacterium]